MRHYTVQLTCDAADCDTGVVCNTNSIGYLQRDLLLLGWLQLPLPRPLDRLPALEPGADERHAIDFCPEHAAIVGLLDWADRGGAKP